MTEPTAAAGSTAVPVHEAAAAHRSDDRTLAVLLFAEGTLVTTAAVLGPLVLDVLHYRTSASGLDQIRGSDLAALTVMAPLCVWIGTLARGGHPAAPLLAMAPAGFSVYIWTQLLFGNEWGRLPGNVEWFAPLLLAVVGVGVAVAIRATRALRGQPPLPWSRRMERATGVLLLAVAGFVAVGIHLAELIDALRDHPVGTGLLGTPNAFWLIKMMDLGIIAPASLLMGIGLLRGHSWARAPAAAVLGGYALLGWSVAAMGWSMVRGGADDASPGLAVGATAIAAAVTGYAVALYRPLFRRGPAISVRRPSPAAPSRHP
ncbi:hypothetical protein E4P39_02560 [Blastococcus sp. CT_GayMR19]|uniref:hypothetical protein n=1 Tax=Blastococcus sp. CT_GayMR19 TaxID=2559608 RepID=UPI0010744FB1|nr:hypothetical protein [Blastococcus sp. CT_GayMR19]TFV79521.1 hypothetical protein E4P39_02560 [Blastococcus sp. CT_GayMR19]